MCLNSVKKPKIRYTRLISILGNQKNAKYKDSKCHTITQPPKY